MNFAYFLLLVMVLASLGLSAVSAYETYLGLIMFMPEGLIGGLFGGIFTFAVQAILFVISWRIAQHLLDPWRTQVAPFAVWLICAFFSGYFSYFGFFQATGGRDENVRINAVQVAQGNIVQLIEADMVADLATRHADNLISASALETWEIGLRTLIDIAKTAERDIEQLARRRETDLSAQRVALQQKRTQLQQVQTVAEADMRLAAQAHASIRQEVESLTAFVSQLRTDIPAVESEINALKVQLQKETETGFGPKSRELELEINTAEAKLAALKTQLEDAEQRLDAKQRSKLISDIEADKNVERNNLNEISGEIEIIDGQIAELNAAILNSREASNLEFGDEGRIYGERLSRLRQHDYAAYDELISSCEVVSRQLTEAGLGDRIPNFNCNNPELAPAVADLMERSAKLERFRTECRENRARVVRDGDLPPEVNGMISQLQNTCVEFAVSPDVAEQAGRTITTLAKERGDHALTFDRTSVALFVDRQSNAVISAIFAIIVDLLVLLCALVGRNVGQPEAVRAIDRIIARMAMPEADEQQYARRLILPQDGNELAMMQPILTQLLSEELAIRPETAPGGHQVLLLRKGALERLKQMRTEKMRGAAAEAAQAPIIPQSINRTARRKF